MAYSDSTTINHGQTANDADGIVTGTIPGAEGDLVLLVSVINNGTATSTCTDNGDAGNPWTRLNSPNPDVVSSNTNLSLWAKVLGATDVGATVTYDGGFGSVRLPVAMAAFSGRSAIADIDQARAQATSASATFDPADLVISADTGWDVVQVFGARVATGTQLTMTGVPTGSTKRAEAATAFGASPNMTVTIVSQDGVGPDTYGDVSATYSASANQVISYTLALKAAPVSTDDGGLRVYLVNGDGSTTELAVWLVDSGGALVELADTGV